MEALDAFYQDREREGSMWVWTAKRNNGKDKDGKRNDDILKLKFSTAETLPQVVCIEQWIPSDSTTPNRPLKTEEKKEEREIIDWVSQDRFPQDCKGSGFKILVIRRTDGRGVMTITLNTYKAILENFHLPPVELHAGSRRQAACAAFVAEDKSYIFVNRSNEMEDGMSYLLRYNPSTNITCGYITVDNKSEWYDYQNCLELIPNQFDACRHPLLIPVLLIELQTESAIEELEKANDMMRDVEAKTRYTSYDDPPDDSEITKIDIQTIGDQHGVVLVNQRLLQCSQFSLKSLCSILDVPASPFGCLDEKYTINIRNRIKYLESSIEHGLIYVGLQQRLEAQQSAVFNLMAQKARNDARKDSSALKIIAIMTTLFLPGTFVSTLFTMPLLDWQQVSVSHVGTRHFWIYWAVTGPFTLAVAAIIYWALFGRPDEDAPSSGFKRNSILIWPSKGGMWLRKIWNFVLSYFRACCCREAEEGDAVRQSEEGRKKP